MTWQAHKFGGTSVADAQCYQNVKSILETYPDQNAVVVSAMAGVTNLLTEAVEKAQNQDEAYLQNIEVIINKHNVCVETLFGKDSDELKKIIASDCENLKDLLKAIFISKSASKEHTDLIQGHGEIWSAQILAKLLGGDTQYVDARDVLIISHGETGPTINWELSREKFKYTQSKSRYIVVTGFIASLENGISTTLGRNGSDFSGSIFANLFDAKVLTIWTDVDGIYSADPRKVTDAICLDTMSFEEAFELSYFGAKVVHPHTMGPAIEKGIAIRIRNSINPSAPGTLIESEPKQSKYPIKGFSTVDGISLVNVEGTGMIGVPGIASRVFASLREVGVSVILISQASSEHSICFAVPNDHAQRAKDALEQSLFSEIHHKKIQKISVEPNCSIIAAVGNNMVQSPGVAANFFKALSQTNVNVKAIAQGSSERNISAVIAQKNASKALQAVHSAFYLSDFTVSLGIVGPGLIGSALLKQLHTQKKLLKDKFRIDLQIRGITNSKKMLLGENLSDNWKKDFEASETKADLEAFANHIQCDKTPHHILIDCTASDYVGSQYLNWLQKGIHIVTPNKKANSGALSYYNEIKNQHGSIYLYEATVGAGLPIISTLRDLVQTGDQINLIEGVFSGTLSYIFNSLASGEKFSDIVKKAKEQGYTEPDPRDDLSGTDVARKVVTLAREMGLEIELSDVEIENLVPEPLRSLESIEEFMQELPKYDQVIKERAEAAAKNGEVLRFVGLINPNGKCSAKIKNYKTEHSFAGTQGSDNIIAFTTDRYKVRPLVIQGPGAGPDVTATGVFSDLLRLIENFGAQR